MLKAGDVIAIAVLCGSILGCVALMASCEKEVSHRISESKRQANYMSEKELADRGLKRGFWGGVHTLDKEQFKKQKEKASELEG